MLMDKRVADIGLWKAGTELGMWLGLGCACQSIALRTSTSSEASVMLALTLVVVSILEICCGRPVTARRVLPVLMAVGGLLLMEAGNAHTGPASPSDPEYVSDGTMWGVASAIGFGVHLFRSDVVQETVSDSIKLGALQLVTCAGFHSIWLLLDYLFSFRPGEALHLLGHLPWGEVVFCGVFATGVAQFLELVCVKYAKASSTAIVFAQVPVVGMVLGFFVQSDRLSLLSLLGSMLVISAAAVPHLLTYLNAPSPPPSKRTPPSKHHTVISMPKPSTGDMPVKKSAMDANILSPRRRADVECAVHCHT
jgi:drug/metabolite transporter (DMT)-like permease